MKKLKFLNLKIVRGIICISLLSASSALQAEADDIFDMPLSREEALLESIANKIEKLDTEAIGPAAVELQKASVAIQKVAPDVQSAALATTGAANSVQRNVDYLGPKLSNLTDRIDSKLDNIDKVGNFSEMLNRKLTGIDFKKTGKVIDEHFQKVESLWSQSLELIEDRTSLQSIASYAVVSQVASLATQELFKFAIVGIRKLVSITYEHLTQKERDRQRSALFKKAVKFHKELNELQNKSYTALTTQIHLLQINTLLLPTIMRELNNLDFSREGMRLRAEKNVLLKRLETQIDKRLDAPISSTSAHPLKEGRRQEDKILQSLATIDQRLMVYEHFSGPLTQGRSVEDLRRQDCHTVKKNLSDLWRTHVLLQRWESELLRGFLPFMRGEEERAATRQKELSRDLQKKQRERDIKKLRVAINTNTDTYLEELNDLYKNREMKSHEYGEFCQSYIKAFREESWQKKQKLRDYRDIHHELEMASIVAECEERLLVPRVELQQEFVERKDRALKSRNEKLARLEQIADYMNILSPYLLEDPTLREKDFLEMITWVEQVMKVRACAQAPSRLTPELAYCAHVDYRYPGLKSKVALTFAEHMNYLANVAEAGCREFDRVENSGPEKIFREESLSQVVNEESTHLIDNIQEKKTAATIVVFPEELDFTLEPLRF